MLCFKNSHNKDKYFASYIVTQEQSQGITIKVVLDELYVVNRHRFHMAAIFSVFADEDNSKLPTFNWSPKLQKRPYVSRFIAIPS